MNLKIHLYLRPIFGARFMKKLLLLLFSLLVGLALLVWVWGMVGPERIIDAFLVFTGWDGLVIFSLTLLMLGIGTWRWREILKAGNIDMPFRKLFGPYLAGFSIMFLAPIFVWGGELVRTYLLKNRNSVDFTKGMASVIIDRILEWTVNLIVIFIGSIFFFSAIGIHPTKLLVIFGGIFFIFLSALAYFYFKCARKESIVCVFVKNKKSKLLALEREMFNFFKWGKPAVWKGIMLSFLRAAVMYVRAWFLIGFLGKIIGVSSALSVLGFSYVAVMIPIPAALGSHEAIQVFAFSSLGLGVSTATAFTMIIRGAELIAALIGIILLFKLGVILIKDALFKKLDNLVEDEKE